MTGLYIFNCSLHPILKWAQRDDLVYITIDLPDAKDVKLKLEPDGKFYFSATSGTDNIPYEIDINLYDKVDANESKASVGSRNVMYLVKKEESKWWARLIKQEGRTPVFIKVDLIKWVDKDEQDEQAGPDMELDDVNFSSLNIGGGGEEDYEDEDESDTEEEIESVTEEHTVSGEPGASNGHVEVKS
ncbi:co-chaperone protein p23-1-like isoform X2 [Bidens hawaiensis]|uniref:co-chaperone protein p23-1-like isoform X2 n=1 Tax=Bidens hawaiensis TaxID=980011 RepID=UPI00404B3C7A